MDPEMLARLSVLLKKLDSSQDELMLSDAYYDGTQPLRFLNPASLNALGDTLLPLVLGWPQLVVDSVEERLDVEGFRFAKDDDADDHLWDVWQANNLDEASQMCHLDSLITRISFVIVGAGATPDIPRVSVESPRQVAVDWDPQSRKVRAAVKQWQDGEGRSLVKHATLYLPNSTQWLIRDKGKWVLDPDMAPDMHNLGVVPVVPFANRVRTLRPDGQSELTLSIRRISDAACKVATDMMTSAEYHAMPRRWATGIGPDDFMDPEGNPVNGWSATAGRIWTTEEATAKMGQFDESSLTNFHATITALSEQLAAMGCLPPQFVGLTTANPASADAIRSSEARLVKRVERKQRFFGGSWEDVMRLVLRLTSGEWDPGARSLETLWAAPSTATRAEDADAAIKLTGAGIVPIEQAREDLGYTATQRARMAAMDNEAAARIVGGDLTSLVGPKPMPEPAPEPVPA